jgi:alanyl-tRNA synthetase
MPSRSSSQVRRVFLDHFLAAGHEEVPSASLVPVSDPTLLFTNAGMNQFKDVFTGLATRANPRATTAQKCVRAGGKHNDLENVGRTARHQTFFEMLGNFSFGDYFKSDAIDLAHRLLIKEYGLDPRRLAYTVHHSDDEAHALWKKIAGVSDDRIVRLGDEDNFWSMGDTGPCGPCSELHYHQGDDVPCAAETAGQACLGVACACDRWIEIWNLVFMQFEKRPGGGAPEPLPRPSIDTGLGLERLCAILGGVRSNYETDLLQPLVSRVADLARKPFVPTDYRDSAPSVSMRAIADHARAAAFLIADGVFPEKTGRSYVLRRIMRRAIYHGWLLGITDPFFASLADLVIEGMDDVYPELRERRGVILEVAAEEERKFHVTLERGLRMLEDESARRGGQGISGEVAFQLYDTYGFPLDLTRVVARSRGLAVDEAGFDRLMEEQRSRGSFAGSGETAVQAVYHALASETPPTSFQGYETTQASAEVVALVSDGARVDRVTPDSRAVAVVCQATPFYGEQGGQMGDSGEMRAPGGTFQVTDTQRPLPALTIHLGTVTQGALRVGDKALLAVDTGRRDAIRRNHSATHLLHWALRHVLGDHVTQKGSLVAPDRLRFDFSHSRPLTGPERQAVEDLVNARVLANVAAETAVLPVAEAKKSGALSFFGEKYGDTVRVLTIAESREFCGGTHVGRTGDIGLCKIINEVGIAQGVRRIEAVTGSGALLYLRQIESELDAAAEALHASPLEVASRIAKQQTELRDKAKEINQLKDKIASKGARPDTDAERVGPYQLVVQDLGIGDPRVLRDAADKMLGKINPGILVLAGAETGKVAVICAVSPGAQDRFHAGTILRGLVEEQGWKGGGRKDMAQGGGPLPASGLGPIVDSWRKQLRDHVTGALSGHKSTD